MFDGDTLESVEVPRDVGAARGGREAPAGPVSAVLHLRDETSIVDPYTMENPIRPSHDGLLFRPEMEAHPDVRKAEFGRGAVPQFHCLILLSAVHFRIGNPVGRYCGLSLLDFPS